jgi:hypothetical protein
MEEEHQVDKRLEKFIALLLVPKLLKVYFTNPSVYNIFFDKYYHSRELGLEKRISRERAAYHSGI